MKVKNETNESCKITDDSNDSNKNKKMLPPKTTNLVRKSIDDIETKNKDDDPTEQKQGETTSDSKPVEPPNRNIGTNNTKSDHDKDATDKTNTTKFVPVRKEIGKIQESNKTKIFIKGNVKNKKEPKKPPVKDFDRNSEEYISRQEQLIDGLNTIREHVVKAISIATHHGFYKEAKDFDNFKKLYDRYKRDLLIAVSLNALNDLFKKIDDIHGVFGERYNAVLQQL